LFQLRRERHSYLQFGRDEQGKLARTEIEVDTNVMVHDAGFQLIRFGQIPRRGGVKFRYVKQNTAFDFQANRRHWGGTVSGTYSVWADFRAGQAVGDGTWPLERATVEAFATDIDTGLRAWPPEHDDETRPIGEAHFYFFTSGGFPITEMTSYRFVFGEPLALREPPSSTRWSEKIIQHPVRKNRDGTDRLLRCRALTRDDGVELIQIATMRGPDNDGPDMYRYSEPGLTFHFYAERRFSLLIVTDTWEVRLDPPRQDGLSAEKRAKLGAAKCRDIVATIEEALFAWIYWPGETEQRRVPVNRVVFVDAP
jgi:hypothetical protein